MAASWLGEVLGPASLRDAATDEVLGLLPALRRLPRRFERITTALERGTLTTSVRLLADDRDRHFVASMVGRAVLAFLGAAFGIISVMLIGVRGRHRRHLAVPRARLHRPVPQPGPDPAGDHRDHPRRYLT